MTLGTGIFLSTIVLAVILLYGYTKDRWQWRRMFKRIALIIVGVLIACGLVIGAAYIYEQIPAHITKQTEYGGIRLGMDQNEVLYKLGDPSSVVADAESNEPSWKGAPIVLDVGKIEQGKSINDYKRWLYSREQSYLNIDFSDDRKSVVAIRCFSSDKLARCPSLAGIEDGDWESDVRKTLGDEPVTKMDGGTKTLIYPYIGIQLKLTEERVYWLQVSSALDPK